MTLARVAAVDSGESPTDSPESVSAEAVIIMRFSTYFPFWAYLVTDVSGIVGELGHILERVFKTHLVLGITHFLSLLPTSSTFFTFC